VQSGFAWSHGDLTNALRLLLGSVLTRSWQFRRASMVDVL
jgi:hypothetical protein